MVGVGPVEGARGWGLGGGRKRGERVDGLCRVAVAGVVVVGRGPKAGKNGRGGSGFGVAMSSSSVSATAALTCTSSLASACSSTLHSTPSGPNSTPAGIPFRPHLPPPGLSTLAAIQFFSKSAARQFHSTRSFRNTHSASTPHALVRSLLQTAYRTSSTPNLSNRARHLLKALPAPRNSWSWKRAMPRA